MAIRMKEWGMLAAPGQPAHVRTQGLFGWERVGRSVGAGLGALVSGAAQLSELERVDSTGELAEFADKLRGIGREVREELAGHEVQDWDYAWNNAAAPRIREAVQELSAPSREAGAELASLYSAQASIEARRDRELRRVTTARGRWEQQVESAVSAGQEEQAACWLEAGRGVFVPEEQMEERREEVRSRASRSRWESRLQDAPLEALAELAEAESAPASNALPSRPQERERLQESSQRARTALRRELARRFSQHLREEQEIEPAAVEQAVKAGVIPAPAGGKKRSLSDSDRVAWYRWLDAREEGEESEVEARLTLATAPLTLAERRSLLVHLERTQSVAASDRRSLSNELFSLYHAGAFGCPGDAVALRALLTRLEEGAALLAEQGAAAAADWVKARRAGADAWVCFEGE